MAIDLIITYYNIEQTATLVQQQLLLGSAKVISEQLEFTDGIYEISIPPAAFELFENDYKDHVYYAVRSKEGRLISGVDELRPYRGLLRIGEKSYFVATLYGELVRVIAYAHALPNSSTGDFVVTQVAQTLNGHDKFRNSLLISEIREHLALLTIMLIALVIMLRWTLSPLTKFCQDLLQRQPGSLERLETDSVPSELEPVIHAINEYVSRLNHVLSLYEQFVANTAHHLRTSFTIIATQIDFGKRADGQSDVQVEVLNAIQKTTRHCTKVINQLLVLASVEQARNDYQDQDSGAIRLSEIIKIVIDELAPLAVTKDIELGVDVFDESIFISASVRLIREVISNLIDNAIQHMGKAGVVTISLSRVADHALLCITDNGIGIPESLHQKAFERFFRVDPATPNSSGLGLAIVKEICELLNSKVTLGEPANGTGLRVEIQFPIIAKLH